VEATKLNVLTEPMAPATFKKGNVQKLEFKLKGDNTHAEGTVLVLYDNLRIDLLEVENDNRLDKKNVTSFLANLFMNDENPDKNEPARVAKVNYQRNMNRSLYNLIWKSVLTGINQTIGNKRKPKRT
jgi:hypothetical protein